MASYKGEPLSLRKAEEDILLRIHWIFRQADSSEVLFPVISPFITRVACFDFYNVDGPASYN